MKNIIIRGAPYLLLLALTVVNAEAATFYSRINGDWTKAATWSNVSCGGAAATTIPSASDDVIICAGHTVAMKGNPGVCFSLTIQGTATNGAGVTNIGAGGLKMEGGTITGTGTDTYNVSGDFTTVGTNNIDRCNLIISGTSTISTIVNITSTIGTKTFTDLLITGTLNNSANSALTINGNLQNNGTFTIGTGSVTFGGASSNTVTGTSTTDFNTITVNKGTSNANIIDVQSLITMAAGGLTMTNGTFKFSSASNITPFTVTLADIIPANAGFWCNGTGIVDMPIDVQYSGTLRISSGTLNIGDAPDERIIAVNGTTILTVEGGTLNIAGRISRGVAADNINFTMSGGTIIVPTIASTSTTFSPINMDQPGSTFTMSAGTIIIQREGGSGAEDLGFLANAGTVGISGGVIQFGDASTPAAQTMQMNSIFNIANLTVNSANATCQLAANLTVLQAVTINSGTLNANNMTLTVGGLWTNSGTFTPGTGTVTFDGTGTQTITNAAGEIFNNVTVNKPSGTVSLANNINVNSTLTMTAGTINCGANTITLGVSIASPGTLTYTAGTIIGRLQRWLNATATNYLFPIGTAAYYRPVTINFTALTGGTLTANFVSTDPGSNGLPYTDGTGTVINQFTEGYWDLTIANGLSSTNYYIECTGNGFTSYAIAVSTRLMYRAASANPWSANGTHTDAAGNTAKRTAVSELSAQFAFGKISCSAYTATSISGNASPCVSAVEIYSVNANNPANTYTWSIIPPAAGSITGGQFTPTATITWGSTGQNATVQVVEANNCGDNNTPVTLAVAVHPIATSAITGAPTVSTNELDVSYSVTNTPGYSYSWSLPIGGGTIDPPGTGNAVTIDWGGTTGTYTVRVDATRLCGPSDFQVLSVTVQGAITSAVNGNWAQASTWTGGVVPTASDYVEIQAVHTVTMNDNPGACRSLTINGTASWTQARTTNVGNGGVILNSTGNITGSGAGFLTSEGGFTGNSNSNISSTTVTIRLQTNPQNITSDGALNRLDITTTATNTGTLTITGTLSGAGTLTQAANSILNMNAATFSLATLNASASGNAVNYGANAAQTIRASTYNDLTVSGTGTKTLGGVTTVNRNLTISSAATTFDVSTSNYELTVGGNWNNSGAFTERFGTVTFNGASAQTITVAGGEIFNNVNMTGAGTKNLSNPITINFDFSLSSTLTTNNNDISIRGNFDNSGTYNGGSNNVTFTNNTNVLGSSTVTFNNVIISATLTGHSSNMNVTGNWTNNGTFNHNSGKITFNGTTTLGGSSASTFNVIDITGTLTGVSSGNFNVVGNWNNTGTFNHNSGTVTFDGTSAQTIEGTTTFNNLTINKSAGGASLTSAQNLLGTLSLTSGAFNTAGQVFTLVSNASGTARIGPVTGGTISGNITMQRYIAGDDDWRLLGSPVSGATLADWNNEINMSGFPGSNDPPNSFKSVASYDETQLGLKEVGFIIPSDTSDGLTVGKGYFIWVGDALGLPITKTIDLVAPATIGSQVIGVTYTNDPATLDDEDGWNLIANPFPSDIGWNSITLSNVRPFAYLWNPNTDTYSAYDQTMGRTIPSHQAFWVKADLPGAGSVTFNEIDKAADGNNYLKIYADQTPHLHLNLTGNGVENTTEIRFRQNATQFYDPMLDAYQLNSLKLNVPNLSTLTSDSVAVDLCINSLPELYADAVIPVRINWSQSGPAGSYTLTAEDLSTMPLSSCIVLEDLWTGNFTDLRVDTSYSFTMTAATNLPARFLLHIGAPLNTSVNDVSCNSLNNGKIFADFPGGTATYTWLDSYNDTIKVSANISGTDSITGLSPGNYSVYVSSPGMLCAGVTELFTISEPSPLVGSSQSANITCNGGSDGSASLSMSGGSSPYSYQWSNGADSAALSGLSAGIYSVSVLDNNGCQQTLSVTLLEPANMVPVIQVMDESCKGNNDGSIGLSVSGGTGGYHYLWSTGDTVAAISNLPGNSSYNITVTDNLGCINATNGIAVDEGLLVLAGFSVSSSIVTEGGKVDFTNISTGGSSYSWNFGDGNTSADASPSHAYSSPGIYTVTLTAVNGSCSDIRSELITVKDDLVGVGEVGNKPEVFIAYKKDILTLEFNLKKINNAHIQVFNLLGQNVFDYPGIMVKKDKIGLALNDLVNGIYVINIILEDYTLSRKITIQDK